MAWGADEAAEEPKPCLGAHTATDRHTTIQTHKVTIIWHETTFNFKQKACMGMSV